MQLGILSLSRPLNYYQVTYTPSALRLRNREIYPNLWQIYPQESYLTSPMTAVVKLFNWTQVKIITQDEAFFQQVCLCIPVVSGISRWLMHGTTCCDNDYVHRCVHKANGNLQAYFFLSNCH